MSTDSKLYSQMVELGMKAKSASGILANLSSEQKNKCLIAMADAILANKDAIEQANRLDIEDAKKAGLSAAMLDRLTLTPKRIETMANGVKEDVACSRAMKLLQVANVAHRSNHFPSEMSGGEQQRVAIARAIANNPEILLADEPTGSLDPQHAAMVFDLLLDLVRKNKMSMLFVTHDMNLAKKADRIITIKDGIVK